jgi:hypothetical protein
MDLPRTIEGVLAHASCARRIVGVGFSPKSTSVWRCGVNAPQR